MMPASSAATIAGVIEPRRVENMAASRLLPALLRVDVDASMFLLSCPKASERPVRPHTPHPTVPSLQGLVIDYEADPTRLTPIGIPAAEIYGCRIQTPMDVGLDAA